MKSPALGPKGDGVSMNRVLALTVLAVFAPLGTKAQSFKPTPQFQASMDLAAAVRSGDVAKAMAALADDAVLLPPGRDLLSGRRSLEETLRELVGKNSLEIALVSIGSLGSAELGLDVGLYEATLKPQGGASPPNKDRGKYVAVYKQDAEGRWRLAYLSWNRSEAAPPGK
jgi:ketosteroid isomerase-like protein